MHILFKKYIYIFLNCVIQKCTEIYLLERTVENYVSPVVQRIGTVYTRYVQKWVPRDFDAGALSATFFS